MELNRSLALLALALLVGCSSSGRSPVMTAIMARTMGAGEAPEPEGPLPPASALRGPVAERGIATLRLEAPATGIADAMAAIAMTGDRLTYLGRVNRTIVMRGGLLSSTHGFGYDLAPVRTNPGDPIVTATPLDAWPDQVSRIYQTAGIGPDGTMTSVTCTYATTGQDSLTLFQPPVAVTMVAETCSGDASFTNRYAVVAATGQIWDSLQWTGPRQGQIKIEVLEPFEE